MARVLFTCVVGPRPELDEFRGVSAKNNKPYHIRKQKVYVDLGGFMPEPMYVYLDGDLAPYEQGNYAITDQAVKIVDGELVFTRISLIPTAKPVAKAG